MEGPVKSLASAQTKRPKSVELLFSNNSSRRQEILMNMAHEGLNSKAACKRTQQLPTFLRQQCWELLRACWQWCETDATTPKNVGTCSASWEGYNP